MDEFAFIPNHIADDFFASVYPTISSASSTPGNTHLSGRAFDLPGWIWVSRAAVGGTAPGSNQAYARALDNSGDTMVYGWMHRTTSPGYESDTMGCINADGTRFHYGGPWQGGTTYAWVMGVDLGL